MVIRIRVWTIECPYNSKSSSVTVHLKHRKTSERRCIGYEGSIPGVSSVRRTDDDWPFFIISVTKVRSANVQVALVIGAYLPNAQVTVEKWIVSIVYCIKISSRERYPIRAAISGQTEAISRVGDKDHLRTSNCGAVISRRYADSPLLESPPIGKLVTGEEVVGRFHRAIVVGAASAAENENKQ